MEPSKSLRVDNALEQQSEVGSNNAYKSNSFENTQLNANKMFIQYQHEALILSWKGLQKRINNTPSIENDIRTYLEMLKKFDTFDTSILKIHLESVLQNMEEKRCESLQKELERLQNQLDASIAAENEAVNNLNEDEEKINNLIAKKKELVCSLETIEKNIQDSQANISNIRGEILHVENARK